RHRPLDAVPLPQGCEMGSEQEEDEGLEGIVEGGDRPMLGPCPPLVAVEEVAEGMRVLEDAQAVGEVVVLVRVEQRLVGEEPERHAGAEGGGEDGDRPGLQSSRPPSTPTMAPLM